MKNTKLLLFSMMALISATMLSVSSCSKDYQGDIDNLKEQVAQNKNAIASLQSAFSAGKMIKTVTPITNGYSITFTDNSTINILNGTNGTNGKDGINGTNGFTPIIGIDASGYWTVITSQGGSPVRIKDANQKDIKAVADAVIPVPNTTTKTWWINGVDTQVPCVGENGLPGQNGSNGTNGHSPYINATTLNWMIWDTDKNGFVDSGVKAKGEDGKPYKPSDVKIINGVLYIDDKATNATDIPLIAYNDVNKTVVITVYEQDGTPKHFNIMREVDVREMITSVSIPSSWGRQYSFNVYWGVALQNTTWENEVIKQGDVLLPGGEIVLPIAINPVQNDFDISKYDVFFENAQGESSNNRELALKVKRIYRGFDFNRYSLSSNGNTNTKAVNTKNNIWSIVVDVNDLKDLKTKDYKYNFGIRIEEKKTKRAFITEYLYYIDARYNTNSGNVFNVISTIFDQKDYSLGDNSEVNTDIFYNTKKSIIDGSYVYWYKHKVEIVGVSSTSATLPEVKQLVKFEHPNDVTINIIANDDPNTVSKLKGAVVKFKVTMLDCFGNTAEKEVTRRFVTGIGPKESYEYGAMSHVLAKNNNKPFVENPKYKIIDLKPVLDKIAASEKMNYWNDYGVHFSVTKNGVDKSRQFGITLLNSSYVTVLNTDDARYIAIEADENLVLPGDYILKLMSYSSATFSINVPLTIQNPVINFNAMFARADWANGSTVSIYGNQKDNPTNPIYTIKDMYKLMTPVETLFGFVDKESQYIDPLNDKVFNIDFSNYGKSIPVTLKYYYFGNKLNSFDVESFNIFVRSSIEDGSIISKTSVANPEVKVNELKKLGDLFKALDYDRIDYKLFGTLSTRDSRILKYKVRIDANNKYVKLQEGATGARSLELTNPSDETYLIVDQLDAPEGLATIHVEVTDQIMKTKVKDFVIKINVKR